MIGRMHDVWAGVDIPVTTIGFADPMSWGMPHTVGRNVAQVIERWPDITRFNFHIHNARGSGIAQIYAVLEVLDERHEVSFDTSCGGIGGCPYCGNGRAAAMVPTEDAVVMLESMGIETGVDLRKLVAFCWKLEKVIGQSLFGHVSRAGWLPRTADELYDPNLPFVVTDEAARHFMGDADRPLDGVRPWLVPIPTPTVGL
jgi:hydroxymethylglutaryl-CoA lyase